MNPLCDSKNNKLLLSCHIKSFTAVRSSSYFARTGEPITFLALVKTRTFSASLPYVSHIRTSICQHTRKRTKKHELNMESAAPVRQKLFVDGVQLRTVSVMFVNSLRNKNQYQRADWKVYKVKSFLEKREDTKPR